MAEDPYAVLGVAKAATPEDIRKAYRALAKASHPDLHPDDDAAEARFKAVNAANDLLSDPDKRARFDRGDIDAEGQQAAPERAYYRDYAQSQAGASRYAAGARPGFDPPGFDPPGFDRPGFDPPSFDPDELNDAFGAFFRQSGRPGDQPRPRRGADRSYRLDVPFLDAINGATERLTLPDGQSLDVRIPPGLTDGQVLRLRGKGAPGKAASPANATASAPPNAPPGGAPGDALIEVSVLPHPFYRRDDTDLLMDLPVTFREAVLGAKIDVPTPRGRVALAVPPRSETGARLRLRGRGVAAHGGRAAGDLYAVLRVVVGPADDALETLLRAWTPPPGPDVRATLAGDVGGEP